MSKFMQMLNKSETPISGEFNVGGGGFDPIPSGTVVSGVALSAQWKDFENVWYIEVEWEVLAPKAYKNRRIFQKVKVNEENDEKAQRAVQMYATIFYNTTNGRTPDSDPTNESMAKDIVMGKANLTLEEWAMNGKEGNWVRKVSPIAPVPEVDPSTLPKSKPKQQPAQQQNNMQDFDSIDSDIPF